MFFLIRVALEERDDQRRPCRRRYAIDIIDEAGATANLAGKTEVTGQDVAALVSKVTGVPTGRLEAGEEQRLMGLERQLGRRVVGQGLAVRAVARAVRK